jgi:hypothetical protein
VAVRGCLPDPLDEVCTEDTATVTVTAAPVLIDLPDITVSVGEAFTITVTFTGDAETAYALTVDWKDGSSPDVVTGLAPGTLLFGHTYDETVERTFEPTVRVEDQHGGVDEGTFLVTLTRPDLVAVKSNDEDGDVELGESWFWSVRVQNIGEAPARFPLDSVVFRDTLPDGADYGSAQIVERQGVSGDLDCVIAGPVDTPGTLRCTAATGVGFDPGGYVDVRFRATPTTGGSFTNPRNGGVCAVDPGDVVAEDREDNNDCEDEVTVRAPDLVASKTNDVNGVSVLGGTWTWTIEIRNIGDAGATFTGGDPTGGFLGDPILSDLLPAEGLSYGTPVVTATGVANGSGIRCELSGSFLLSCYGQAGDVVIPPGGTIVVEVPVAALDTGDFTNPRDLLSCGVDPIDVVEESDEINNICIDTVTVGAPNLRAAKSNDTDGQGVAGSSFNWRIAVRNTGNAPARFRDGETIVEDHLPTEADYGIPAAVDFDNVTGTQHVTCELNGGALACRALGGDVTLGPSAGQGPSFRVVLPVTPTSVGQLDNPSGGICRVDPETPAPGRIAESDESDNDCADSVSVNAGDPDRASGNPGPGGTIATGGGGPATPDNVTVTSVTTPTGGQITISESNTAVFPSPAGYTFLGQAVAITAPDETRRDPLRITIRLDASAVPDGVDEARISAFRDGVVVADCADPAAGRAAPNPCSLPIERLGDDDLRVTILTTQASEWSMGFKKRKQGITFPKPPNLLMGDEPVPLMATADSGLPVSYSVEGPCELVGNGLDLLAPVAPGECLITASQHGNEVWAPAADKQRKARVSQRRQSITFDKPPNLQVGGEPVALTATADSGLPVSYVVEGPCELVGDGLDLLAPVSPGECLVTVSQKGNEIWEPAADKQRRVRVDPAPPVPIAPSVPVEGVPPP